MIVFFLACLDPSGTVVGNPGTGSIYQARTTVAESEGFTYMEASISLESIDYYDENGLVDTTEFDTRIDLLDPNSKLSLMGGMFTQLTFSFSQTDPMLLSATNDEIGSVDLEIPIQQLTFARDNIKINGPAIVQLGKKNWLKLENVENASVLQGLLENTSNVYSDDNENGELEEEEQDSPITELEEEVEYILQGTWTTDLWYYGDNQGFENAILNLSPEGFLFQADRKINVESNEVLNDNSIACNGIHYPEEISKEGYFPIIGFATGQTELELFYQFLDQDTLIISHISSGGNIQNIVSRSDTHNPVSFDVPFPQDSNIDIIALQNISMGTLENPVHTTTASLSAKACFPEKITVESAENSPDKVTITSESSEEQLWVRIPPHQVDTIQNLENSEIHIFHDGIWENLFLNNKSNHSISYRGSANSISVFNEGEGDTSLFGSATNLSLTTMGAGSIHAFEFPSHSIDVELMGEGDIDIYLQQQENELSPSGVFGILTGSGTLSIISDPTATVGSSPIEVSNSGTGTISLLCLEENPPEQCESFN